MADCNFIRMLCGGDDVAALLLVPRLGLQTTEDQRPEAQVYQEPEAQVEDEVLGQMTPWHKPTHRSHEGYEEFIPYSSGHPVHSTPLFSELWIDLATGGVYVAAQYPILHTLMLTTRIGTIRGYDAAVGESSARFGGYNLADGKLTVLTHDAEQADGIKINTTEIDWDTLKITGTDTYSIPFAKTDGNPANYTFSVFQAYKYLSNNSIVPDTSNYNQSIAPIGQSRAKGWCRIDQEPDAVTYWVPSYRLTDVSTTPKADSGFTVFPNGRGDRTYTFDAVFEIWMTGYRFTATGGMSIVRGDAVTAHGAYTLYYTINNFDSGRAVGVTVGEGLLQAPEDSAFPVPATPEYAVIRRPFYQVPISTLYVDVAVTDEMTGYTPVVDDINFARHPGVLMTSDTGSLVNIGGGVMIAETNTPLSQIPLGEPNPADAYYAATTGIYTSSTMSQDAAQLHNETMPGLNYDGTFKWGLSIPWGVPRSIVNFDGKVDGTDQVAGFHSPQNDDDTEPLIDLPSTPAGAQLRRVLTVAATPSTEPWSDATSEGYFTGEMPEGKSYTAYRAAGLTAQFATLDLDQQEKL